MSQTDRISPVPIIFGHGARFIQFPDKAPGRPDKICQSALPSLPLRMILYTQYEMSSMNPRMRKTFCVTPSRKKLPSNKTALIPPNTGKTLFIYSSLISIILNLV